MGIELAASSFRSHKHRAFAKREGERSMEPLNFANSSLRSLARLPANFPAIMSFRPSGSVYSSSLPRRGHCLCSDFRARECTSINASEALTAEREREREWEIAVCQSQKFYSNYESAGRCLHYYRIEPARLYYIATLLY